MSQRKKKGVATLWARLSALCPEREIFLRSGGQVKFIRISKRAQLMALGILSTGLVGWGAVTVSMLASSAAVAHDRAMLDAKGAAVASKARKVDGYRKSVNDLAHDLEARQDFIDDLYKTHFGEPGDAAANAPVGKADAATEKAGQGKLDAKISMAPEAAPLMQVDARQRRFAALLTSAVEARAQKAAAAGTAYLADNASRERAVSHLPAPSASMRSSAC